MSPTPNSDWMPAGGWKDRDPTELHWACSRFGQVGLLTNMPTAAAYLGVAPMKNADWARFVVPVLAMTSWPLFSPRPAAVPPGWVSNDIAQSASAAWAGVSTSRCTIWAGMTWLPSVICWMTCGLEYSPWLASVAI